MSHYLIEGAAGANHRYGNPILEDEEIVWDSDGCGTDSSSVREVWTSTRPGTDSGIYCHDLAAALTDEEDESE